MFIIFELAGEHRSSSACVERSISQQFTFLLNTQTNKSEQPFTVIFKDDSPALNADRQLFEFSSWGSIPVFNRQTFLDQGMQSYNRTLDIYTSTNVR